jgi:hypothetical protein
MIKNKNLLFALKILLLIILFLSALYFENAYRQRLIGLIVIFVLFLVNNISKYFLKDHNKLFLLFFLDILLIYMMESNSRLLTSANIHRKYKRYSAFRRPGQVSYITGAGGLIVRALCRYLKCLLKFYPSCRLI